MSIKENFIGGSAVNLITSSLLRSPLDSSWLPHFFWFSGNNRGFLVLFLLLDVSLLPGTSAASEENSPPSHIVEGGDADMPDFNDVLAKETGEEKLSVPKHLDEKGSIPSEKNLGQKVLNDNQMSSDEKISTLEEKVDDKVRVQQAKNDEEIHAPKSELKSEGNSKIKFDNNVPVSKQQINTDSSENELFGSKSAPENRESSEKISDKTNDASFFSENEGFIPYKDDNEPFFPTYKDNKDSDYVRKDPLEAGRNLWDDTDSNLNDNPKDTSSEDTNKFKFPEKETYNDDGMNFEEPQTPKEEDAKKEEDDDDPRKWSSEPHPDDIARAEAAMEEVKLNEQRAKERYEAMQRDKELLLSPVGDTDPSLVDPIDLQLVDVDDPLDYVDPGYFKDDTDNEWFNEDGSPYDSDSGGSSWKTWDGPDSDEEYRNKWMDDIDEENAEFDWDGSDSDDDPMDIDDDYDEDDDFNNIRYMRRHEKPYRRKFSDDLDWEDSMRRRPFGEDGSGDSDDFDMLKKRGKQFKRRDFHQQRKRFDEASFKRQKVKIHRRFPEDKEPYFGDDLGSGDDDNADGVNFWEKDDDKMRKKFDTFKKEYSDSFNDEDGYMADDDQERHYFDDKEDPFDREYNDYYDEEPHFDSDAFNEKYPESNNLFDDDNYDSPVFDDDSAYFNEFGAEDKDLGEEEQMDEPELNDYHSDIRSKSKSKREAPLNMDGNERMKSPLFNSHHRNKRSNANSKRDVPDNLLHELNQDKVKQKEEEEREKEEAFKKFEQENPEKVQEFRDRFEKFMADEEKMSLMEKMKEDITRISNENKDRPFGPLFKSDKHLYDFKNTWGGVKTDKDSSHEQISSDGLDDVRDKSGRGLNNVHDSDYHSNQLMEENNDLESPSDPSSMESEEDSDYDKDLLQHLLNRKEYASLKDDFSELFSGISEPISQNPENADEDMRFSDHINPTPATSNPSFGDSDFQSQTVFPGGVSENGHPKDSFSDPSESNKFSPDLAAELDRMKADGQYDHN